MYTRTINLVFMGIYVNEAFDYITGSHMSIRLMVNLLDYDYFKSFPPLFPVYILFHISVHQRKDSEYSI